jgi:thiol-disulfide isomerase/thioredoxin
MRNFLLIILTSAIILDIQGQAGFENRCPSANTAAQSNRNITITTTDGITRNLYNTLDSGKTVFIDLFYTTCSWCQTYAPVIEEIYQNSGAGEGDIVFWGISNNLYDPDEVIDQYRANYNVSNPCAGPDGGGTTAHTTVIAGQNFLGWPTYCVICPDRTMYFDPCYPPTVTGFDPYFESCGAFVGVEDTKREKAGITSIYPVPANNEISIEILTQSSQPITVNLINLLGTKVLSSLTESGVGYQTIKISTQKFANGFYLLNIIQNGQVIGIEKVQIAH